MERLPEELQLRILEYLDSPPPSQQKARHEPKLNLASSETSPLKNISCASKHWRRITLPLLFQHACLRVDRPVRDSWTNCCLRDETPSRTHSLGKPPQDGIDQYHDDILRASPRTVADMSATDSLWIKKMRDANHAEVYEQWTKYWASRIYHASKDLIDFIMAHNLEKRIASFVLLSDSMQCGKVEELPSPVLYDWRYEAAAAMWQHLLSIIDPQRVAIIAPPMELACFCNCFISLDGAWAFTDMEYHILTLEQAPLPPNSSSSSRLSHPVSHATLQPIPDPSTHTDIAPSSLLHLRPWTSLALNEGSFLKAYGTYEYFERGPPSLTSSIISSLLGPDNEPNPFAPAAANAQQLFDPSQPPPTQSALPSLRHFTYTAIFPFANHLDFLSLLPSFESLDLQFAPDPQSGILDSRDRTGRAELQDCWQELISGYHDVATAISTFRMNRQSFPRLEKFVCRDVAIPALREDLDHIFTLLCLPVWAEYTAGVFTRLADQADLPDEIV